MQKLTKNLTVSVLSAFVLLSAGCSDDNEIFFKDGVILQAEDGRQTVSFTAGENWTASVGGSPAGTADWCSVYPTSGNAGNASITISAGDNTGYDDRAAVI